MLKPIKNYWLNKALLFALLVSALIVVLSLINPANLPSHNISVSDKFLHALAYTFLMWSWLLVFRNNTTFTIKLLLFLLLVLFGVFLEFLQGNLTDYRTFDWNDALANTIGLILGLLSFRFVYRMVFT